jgi:hypothetical protein
MPIDSKIEQPTRTMLDRITDPVPAVLWPGIPDGSRQQLIK